MYSRVNTTVKNHSSASSAGPQRACIVSKLSSMTTPTLVRMSQIRTRSKRRPADVSDSKMSR
jgi:hypothetical protein